MANDQLRGWINAENPGATPPGAIWNFLKRGYDTAGQISRGEFGQELPPIPAAILSSPYDTVQGVKALGSMAGDAVLNSGPVDAMSQALLGFGKAMFVPQSELAAQGELDPNKKPGLADQMPAPGATPSPAPSGSPAEQYAGQQAALEAILAEQGRAPNGSVATAQPQAGGPRVSGGGGGYPMPQSNLRADYSPLMDIVKQMMPQQVDPQAVKNRELTNKLVGLMFGIQNADAQGGDYGINIGKGIMAADGVSAEAKKSEEETFRAGLMDYYQNVFNVTKMQIDADQDFAKLVYQTQMKNIAAAADARADQLKAMQGKIVSSGGQFFRQAMVPDGQGGYRPVVEPIQVPGQEMENFTKNLTGVLAGVPNGDKIAKSIAADRMMRGGYDPSTIIAAQLYADPNARESFIDGLGPDAAKAFRSVGMDLNAKYGGTMSESEISSQSTQMRIGVLMDLINSDPAVRGLAMQKLYGEQ